MDVATAMLEYGGQADAVSKNGFSPLHLAAMQGHTDIVSLLLENGATANCFATVCLFVCLLVYLFVCLLVCLFVCLFALIYVSTNSDLVKGSTRDVLCLICVS